VYGKKNSILFTPLQHTENCSYDRYTWNFSVFLVVILLSLC
jgi:hypothetical protein